MNLELTAEQLALRDTVREFLSAKAGVDGHVRPMLADPVGTTDEIWRGLADLGTTGLLVPVEHGGEGMSMVEAAIVCEELGAALHPGPWLSSAVAAPRALLRFGAAAASFSGLADGSTVAAVAPHDAGITRDDDRLHGELESVPDVAAAQTLFIPVGAEQPALVAVSTSEPGLQIAQIHGIDQSRKLFRLSFDNVAGTVVAATSRAALESLHDDMIVAWAADAVGAARQVLHITVEYAKVRRQFGAPIGSFQAVAHLCAEMYETVELARSGVQYAVWAADCADHAERHLAALRVKAFAGQLAGVGDKAIAVFGGIGFTWEHDAQLYLKRLLSFSRFLGSPGDYLQQVGHELIRNAS
ncbi:acyl-CoA dehydrogenase [Mycolicibacterium rhodesiae NBB3]|uniref:Acyl-CoA dehydrogenase n=1 Tax=Mycolicibacterium rhodesiae (strain NBB3) TaxID=710685 RepID=G8RP69_MYCRN|nr:acyl-CoA dehydrogenase family protein [Mycolicibacterium rhodesiae]AEV76298.1 acyl-CoA dehydrogenase [Mycolicibacterium rhodesiae NBB3]